MIIEQLFTNPLFFLSFAIAIVIGVTFHEFSHAFVAYLQGDPTAKLEGRLTLNPAKHFTLWGTLFLLFAGFGWGKPVPVNPYNFRNQKYGHLLVSLAGPFSNLLVVAFFSVLLRILLVFNIIHPESGFILLFGTIIIINTWLMIFNLIPVPPLDGSTVLFTLLPERYENVKRFLYQYGIWILIFLLITGVFHYVLSFGTFFVLTLFGVSSLVMGIF